MRLAQVEVNEPGTRPADGYLGRSPQWERVFRVAPYGLLAFLAGISVIVRSADGEPYWFELAGCAATAAWIYAMLALCRKWRYPATVVWLFIAGLVVIMSALVLHAPWFGFLAAIGYSFCFALLPWPQRLFGIAGFAFVGGTAQMSGMPIETPLDVASYAAVIVFNLLAVGGLAAVLQRHQERTLQRDRSIAQVREANRRLEDTLADNSALHDQLVAQAREAGVFDERQRMAREIHDTLAQGLAGIITQLQAAEHAADDPNAWRRHLQSATGLARDSLAEARRSVDALRPEPLELARLGDALADVARRWSTQHGVTVRTETTGTVRPLTTDAETALLRVAQEALANVAKHAGAGRVGVTLSYLDGEVALDVRDDGTGFDPDRAVTGTGGGFGLITMRQRIAQLSGTLRIESEPGAGTAVSARVPAGRGPR